MNKQISLSGLMDELSQAGTKKREFLEQMDRLIPWGKWVEEIRPCYYKGERGNKPYGIELMLRLYVLQNLNTLSDEGTISEVIDSRAFSEFCGVTSSNQVPDGDTLGRFRNLLIRNGIQERLHYTAFFFSCVGSYLFFAYFALLKSRLLRCKKPRGYAVFCPNIFLVFLRWQALAERGYEALGGEVFALFLPVLYWMMSRVLRDILGVRGTKTWWVD